MRYYGTWVEELEESVENLDDRKIVPLSEETSESSEDGSESEDASDLSYANRSSSLLATRTSSFQIDFISNSFDPRIEFDDDSLPQQSNTSEDVFEFAHSTDEDPSTHDSTDLRRMPAVWTFQDEWCMLINKTLRKYIQNLSCTSKWSFVKTTHY